MEESGFSLLHDLSVSKNKNKLEIYILLLNGDVCTLRYCFQFCVMSSVSSELYGISLDKLFLSDTRYSFEKCFEFRVLRIRIVWNSTGTVFLGYDVIRLAIKYVLSSIGILRIMTTICCQFLVTSIR